jgi:hypothetical protein
MGMTFGLGLEHSWASGNHTTGLGPVFYPEAKRGIPISFEEIGVERSHPWLRCLELWSTTPCLRCFPSKDCAILAMRTIQF